MLVGVILALDLRVAELLLGMRPDHLQPWHTVDHIHRQTEPVDLILDRQLERRVDVAFLLAASNVQVVVVRTPVDRKRSSLQGLCRVCAFADPPSDTVARIA
jgi:hypothetical protein